MLDSSQVFTQFLRRYAKGCEATNHGSAARPSLCSDKFDWYLPANSITTKINATAAIFTVCCTGFNIINEVNLKNQIRKQCNSHRSDAEWNKVWRLLQTEPFAPGRLVANYLEIMGTPEELFGNILPRAIRLYAALSYKDFDREIGSKNAIPVKFCEYKDKGSLRSDHGEPAPRLSSCEIEELPRFEITDSVRTAYFFGNISGLRDNSTTVREYSRRQQHLEEERRKADQERRRKLHRPISKMLKKLYKSKRISLELYEEYQIIHKKSYQKNPELEAELVARLHSELAEIFQRIDLTGPRTVRFVPEKRSAVQQVQSRPGSDQTDFGAS